MKTYYHKQHFEKIYLHQFPCVLYTIIITIFIYYNTSTDIGITKNVIFLISLLCVRSYYNVDPVNTLLSCIFCKKKLRFSFLLMLHVCVLQVLNIYFGFEPHI